jgi:hypothetical protein
MTTTRQLTSPKLEATGLRKSYGQGHAVRDVEVTVRRG